MRSQSIQAFDREVLKHAKARSMRNLMCEVCAQGTPHCLGCKEYLPHSFFNKGMCTMAATRGKQVFAFIVKLWDYRLQCGDGRRFQLSIVLFWLYHGFPFCCVSHVALYNLLVLFPHAFCCQSTIKCRVAPSTFSNISFVDEVPI